MKAFLCIILVATIISGCQSNPKCVPNLHYGMTREDVDDTIRGDERHEFSALLNDELFRCYSIEFGRRAGAKYFFLFKDNRLISIVRSAPFFAWEVIDEGDRKRSVQAPWDEEERMQEILAAAPLAIDDLRTDVATRLEEASKEKDADFNVLPAFAILAPVMVPYLVSHNRRERKWAKRFDPEMIGIGMPHQKCDETYGAPAFIVPHEEYETRVYGPAETLWRENGRVSLGAGSKYRYWTAVRFERDKAVRIFSNSLFNEETHIQIEYAAGASENDEPIGATNGEVYGTYYCALHGVWFDSPTNPHMEHSTSPSSSKSP